MQPVVGIVMGSSSDFEVMNQAATVLERFGVEYEIRVVSAHRTPEAMLEYGSSAKHAWPQGPDRRCRRRRAPARHARRVHHAAGDRRARRPRSPRRPGFTALDRPDAPRRARRHRRDQRRGERRRSWRCGSWRPASDALRDQLETYRQELAAEALAPGRRFTKKLGSDVREADAVENFAPLRPNLVSSKRRPSWAL